MRIAPLLLAFVAATATPTSAQQQPTWLGELTAWLDGFSADFTYTVSSDLWDDVQSLSGTLIVRGNHYRVDTGSEIILSHGEDTYVYRSPDNQVLITPGDPAYSPATLFGDFNAYYTITSSTPTTLRDDAHHLVRLRPRAEDSAVSELMLWIRNRDGMAVRVRSEDVNGTTLDIELTALNLRPVITPQTFALDFPEGVEIIDLRH